MTLPVVVNTQLSYNHHMKRSGVADLPREALAPNWRDNQREKSEAGNTGPLYGGDAHSISFRGGRRPADSRIVSRSEIYLLADELSRFLQRLFSLVGRASNF